MVDVRRDKELLYTCGLVWVSPGLLAGAYSLGLPVPLSLCSCAMAPMVKATKPTATAAATFVSIDSFIRFSYPLKYMTPTGRPRRLPDYGSLPKREQKRPRLPGKGVRPALSNN